MSDDLSLTPVGAAAGATYWFLDKFLSPTVESFGEALRERIYGVFERGEKVAKERGLEIATVPRKLAIQTINAAAESEDSITNEYLAGVLASSMSGDGLDDRGVPLVAMIRRLSHYQIMMHYLCYHAIWAAFNGHGRDYGFSDHRAGMQWGFTLDEIFDVTGWKAELRGEMISHCLTGLQKESLIEAWQLGGNDFGELNIGLRTEAFSVIPSIAGFELFFWGHGLSNYRVAEVLSGNYKLEAHPWAKLAKGNKPLPTSEFQKGAYATTTSTQSL